MKAEKHKNEITISAARSGVGDHLDQQLYEIEYSSCATSLCVCTHVYELEEYS